MKNFLLLLTLVFTSINNAYSEERKNTDQRYDLNVQAYIPGSDSLQFKWLTHIAFGPGKQEVICDLKNNRFLFRNSSQDHFEVTSFPLKGQHSLVYNPTDKLYYINDTDNHRIIAVTNLSESKVSIQTKTIAGVSLKRPHDIVLDKTKGWLYAINPNSGHVFRFSAIGKNESVIKVPVEGYARSLTLVDGKLYVIGSAKGRIVEIVDWDKKKFKIYDSFDPTKRNGPAGSWVRTGLVLNDLDFFTGYWYATSYFTKSYAKKTDCDKNKFIRFKTLDDLVAGKWTDLSNMVPSGMTPYYLTVKGNELYLAIFNHESPGKGDAILKFTSVKSH